MQTQTGRTGSEPAGPEVSLRHAEQQRAHSLQEKLAVHQTNLQLASIVRHQLMIPDSQSAASSVLSVYIRSRSQCVQHTHRRTNTRVRTGVFVLLKQETVNISK